MAQMLAPEAVQVWMFSLYYELPHKDLEATIISPPFFLLFAHSQCLLDTGLDTGLEGAFWRDRARRRDYTSVLYVSNGDLVVPQKHCAHLSYVGRCRVGTAKSCHFYLFVLALIHLLGPPVHCSVEGERTYITPCLVPDVFGKVFTIPSLNIILALGFFMYILSD